MNGTSISNSSQRTKPESVDPEIDKIADEIKKINAQKMVQLKNTVTISRIAKNSADSTKNDEIPEDWSSVQGHFGWKEIGKELIPHITRAGEHFVSERMTKAKLFSNFTLIFTDEIWDYLPIKKICATAAEAKLLNEINSDHCDYSYGKEQFTENDKIYLLQDALESYEFLNFCHVKLVKKEFSSDQRCGFIKIDKASLVPYVLVNDKKCVPLFYFEDDYKYLEKNAIDLKGWDLAYLKFVCKIQGIRRPLFDKDVIEVVELEYVQKFFSPGTDFEACWEIDNLKIDIMRTSAEINAVMARYVMKPIQPKATKRAAPGHQKPAVPYSTYQKQMYHPYRPNHPTYSVNRNQQQPPSGQTYSSNYPRPVSSVQNSYSTSSVPSSPVVNEQVARASSSQNSSKCYRIPEVEHQNSPQYFLSRREIDGKVLVACINMEPFNPTTLLVTLEELAGSIFKVDIKCIKNAINAMCLVIYMPNREQMSVLHTMRLSNTEGLIRVNKLVENLLQIKYILGLK